MATEQAVENRRANRAARKAWEREQRLKREQHDRDVAARMTKRFFPPDRFPDGPPLIALDYRYWQARRCGWDALDETFARTILGVLCHPLDSFPWYWWTRLHYKCRSQLVQLSQFRLVRR